MVYRVFLALRVHDEHPQRHNMFHSCCTIRGKVCKFIIDFESCENLIAEDFFNKLNLIVEPHPFPYKLAWLQQGTYVFFTHRVLLYFSIGHAYKDQMHCDVVLIDVCHLVSGIYDRNI